MYWVFFILRRTGFSSDYRCRPQLLELLLSSSRNMDGSKAVVIPSKNEHKSANQFFKPNSLLLGLDSKDSHKNIFKAMSPPIATQLAMTRFMTLVALLSVEWKWGGS